MRRTIVTLGVLAPLPIPAGVAAQSRPVACMPFESYPANGCVAWIRDSWYTFDPLQIPAGTTVTWINTTQQPHTVTDNRYSFDSGAIDPGGTYSHTFPAPGSYTDHCAVHPDMRGDVMVT